MGSRDPDITLSGTHTLFPLSEDRILILTNLSWARNPYGNPLKQRPNPDLFRHAMFNFQDIQTGKNLSRDEVLRINYIMKARAHRYIAAREKQWLYPESEIKDLTWDKLTGNHILMPDPRSMIYSSGVVIGFKGGGGEAFDAYGRRPGQAGYENELNEREWETFHAFQGEFARLYGRRRRGQSHRLGGLDPEEDTEDHHRYHLRLEQQNRKYRFKG